jgi:hypothetical protein
LRNTPGTSESHEDEVGECHTSSRKDARTLGKKKAKEQQRQGKNYGSPFQKIYMDALETMWSKKKECEDLKEKKKKRAWWYVLRTRATKDWWQKRYGTENSWRENDYGAEKDYLSNGFRENKTWKKMVMGEKRLQLQESELDDKVMAMNFSGMTEVQQEYYKRMQHEMLARRFGGGSCWEWWSDGYGCFAIGDHCSFVCNIYGHWLD